MEKAIKALLIKRSVKFPYVHDLALLLTLLEGSGVKLPESIMRAEGLTRYAVATRYPGLSEPVTEAQYQEAIAIAEETLKWVEEML